MTGTTSFSNLPFELPDGLIAGPIVRRAEAERVCVWIATTTPVTGSLFVYRAGREGDGPVARGGAESVRLGERLHVHLLTAVPVQPSLPTDELLSYDIELGDPAPRARLADLGLLGGPVDLALPGCVLPTFFVRESLGPLHLLHGSCHKLQGKGQEALVCADELLAETGADPARRPSALFLTGDQIYGDDTPAAALLHLHRLGVSLVGGLGVIPGIPPLAELGVGGRQLWMQGQAGFTSPHAANHLMTFGEYAASYLLAFSDTLWPAALDQLQQPVVPARPGRRAVARRRLASHLADLERARVSLPAVRRVLANIATYMIFDDHDVTDDWNLTRSWRDRVSRSPAGRRIVANALVAFWAFQGWGNDPSLFDSGFKEAIETHLSRGEKSTGERFDQVLWDFDRWSFCAPTKPVAVCLDTRTQRAYDTDEAPARLIGRAGLDRVGDLVARCGHPAGKPLILVSATPVCGLELHELGQKFLAAELGPYMVDFEGWHSNPNGLIDLMRFLAHELGHERSIILSGDVHYAMTVDVRFSVDGKTIHLAQLVSSGLKHSGTITKQALSIVGQLNRSRHERVGWAAARVPNGAHRPRWRLPRPSVKPDSPHDGPVFLSPAQARELGIDQPPDYREVRTYLHPRGPSHSPLIGENNIGSVLFDGRHVTHRVLSRGEHTTAHEASIDLFSAAPPEPARRSFPILNRWIPALHAGGEPASPSSRHST